jgi:hypothetical protein
MLKPTIHLLVAASMGLIAATGDARADNRITITSDGTNIYGRQKGVLYHDV